MSSEDPLPRQCSLRLMEHGDLAQVLRIERASYEFPWSEGIFRDCLKAGYHCLLVIEEQQIIGYGILILAGEEAHILNVCIQSEARGNGFSRTLLQALINTAVQAGALDIFLEVRPSNEVAINLYLSLGFNEAGRRPDYYNAGSGREDALIFVKSIQAVCQHSQETR